MKTDTEIQDSLFLQKKIDQLNITMSFKARKQRKVLLFGDKNLMTLPNFLANILSNWLSKFQIVTEYQEIEIDNVSVYDET